VLMKINDDRSLAGMIPIAIGCGVAISYSWTKWQRGRKTPSQSHSSDSPMHIALQSTADGGATCR